MRNSRNALFLMGKLPGCIPVPHGKVDEDAYIKHQACATGQNSGAPENFEELQSASLTNPTTQPLARVT